jgi:hypothetical protein
VWAESASGGRVGCATRTATGSAARAAGTKAAKKTKLVLKSPSDESGQLAFLEHRYPEVLSVQIDADRAATARERSTIGASLIGDLQRADHAARFPRSQSLVRKSWSPGKRHLLVGVCLDPKQKTLVDPGSYTGVLRVEGPLVSDVNVPIAVTLRDDRWWLVIAWAVAGALAGVLVKLVTDTIKLQTPPVGTKPDQVVQISSPGSLELLRSNASQLAFVLSVAVGLVVAIGAFFTIYLNNESFGTSSNDWFKLTASCFGATVSGMTITDLGKRVPADVFKTAQ